MAKGSSSSSRGSSSASASKGGSTISVSRNSNGSYTVSSGGKSTTYSSASAASAGIKSAAASSGQGSSGGWSVSSGSSGSSNSSSSTTGNNGSTGTIRNNNNGTNTVTLNNQTSSNSTKNNVSASKVSQKIGGVDYTFSRNSNGTINITANGKTSTVAAGSQAGKLASSYLSGSSNTSTNNTPTVTDKTRSTTTNTRTVGEGTQNGNTITYANGMKLTKNSNGTYTVDDGKGNKSTVSANSSAASQFAKEFSSSTNTSSNNNTNNTITNNGFNTQKLSSTDNTVTFSVNGQRMTLRQNSNGTYTVIDGNGQTTTVSANSAAGKTFAQQFSNAKADNAKNTLSNDTGTFKMDANGNTGTYVTPGGEKFTVQLTADGKYVAIDSKGIRHQFVSKNALVTSLSGVEARRNEAKNDSFNSLTNQNNNNKTTDNLNKKKEELQNQINQEKNEDITKTKNLDVGDYRTQRMVTDADGNQTYIAPNGKRYPIYENESGEYAIRSKVDGKEKSFEDLDSLIAHINANNQKDGINRNNVDNKNKVPGGEVEGTYNAPSGKEYDILVGTGANAGQRGYIGNDGKAHWFDSWDAAKAVIDANNPVGSSDLAKNEPLVQRENENYFDEEGGMAETGEPSIDAMNEYNEGREEAGDERYDEFEDTFMNESIPKAREESEETYNRKVNIIQTLINDISNYANEMNDAINDLQEKAKMVENDDMMRLARARAREMAAKGYLTSEQVNQVAAYSLAEYRAELQAKANEADQKAAELRTKLIDKKQELLANVRSQQWTNENERLEQENYINDRIDKMLQYIDGQRAKLHSETTANVNDALKMNAQQELGYSSIIKQNDAQNVVEDRNQQRAFEDPSYRRDYILQHISDTNLHAYADRIINNLIKQNKFIYQGESNARNKQLLSEQITAIAEGAKLLEQKDTLANKS